MGNDSAPKIIINDTIFFSYTAISILVISNHNSFGCCLTKLLPCILFEKCINILASEMASQGNRHCANCVGSMGALSFPIVAALGRGAQKAIAISRPSVCPLAYFRNHVTKLYHILNARYTRPCLGPLLAALRYVMYFRYYR